MIIDLAHEHIPCKRKKLKASVHPWLNAKCRNLILLKQQAAGTDLYQIRQKECSNALHEAYCEYVTRTKMKIKGACQSSKQWWQLSNTLMCRKTMVESIPPLQKADGEWKTSPLNKANILAECFAEKFKVPEVVDNVYSHIPEKMEWSIADF